MSKPSPYSVASGHKLKTHSETIQVCTRCLLDKIRYGWAFGTVWPANPLKYYAA